MYRQTLSSVQRLSQSFSLNQSRICVITNPIVVHATNKQQRRPIFTPFKKIPPVFKYFNFNQIKNYNEFYSRINTNNYRYSSQLYPTTSQSFEAVMDHALTIVGNTDSYSTLRQYIRGEFSNISKYLSKLVGTNHPMLETAKRCSYIAEGRMGSAQARGLIVMLTAKALTIQQQQQQQQDTNENIDLLKRQLSLAEMTEMTYSAYMIHRGVMDVRAHLEYEHNDDVGHAKGVNYGNKVAILCGDFLLAYVMRGLGDLYNSHIVDCIATAITQFMEGEFLLIEDYSTSNYLRTPYASDVSRWESRAFASIGSLQGNSCQSAALLTASKNNENILKASYEFGKNLGLAWQAHTELQPFLIGKYEPVELAEMPPYPAYDLNSLPVIYHIRSIIQDDPSQQKLDQLISQISIENI